MRRKRHEGTDGRQVQCVPSMWITRQVFAVLYSLYLMILVVLMSVDREYMPGNGWALAQYLGIRNGEVPNVGMFFVYAIVGGILVWLAARLGSEGE